VAELDLQMDRTTWLGNNRSFTGWSNHLTYEWGKSYRKLWSIDFLMLGFKFSLAGATCIQSDLAELRDSCLLSLLSSFNAREFPAEADDFNAHPQFFNINIKINILPQRTSH
jgi:hypothetical protein